jgi:nucleotide-binding universal stress UspA family protein
MLELILVPLDGSDASEAAIKAIALIPSRRVRLLAVKSETADLTAICSAERDCEAYLERVAEPLRRQGRKVDTVVAFGAPAQLIVAAAAIADLVVMASHGRGTMGAFVLGSVASWVARHAPVPTMIVRTGDYPVKLVSLTRIVVPLDGSPLAEAALPAAAELASALGLPVHVVHVVDVDVWRATVQAGAIAAEAYAEKQASRLRHASGYLATQVQNLRHRGLVADSELRTGSPIAELLAAIHEGDAVVLAPHDRGGLQRWFLGSVADELIHRAAGPVVIVRPTALDADLPRDDRSAATRATSVAMRLAGGAL